MDVKIDGRIGSIILISLFGVVNESVCRQIANSTIAILALLQFMQAVDKMAIIVKLL
jgi:hypothetical protein